MDPVPPRPAPEDQSVGQRGQVGDAHSSLLAHNRVSLARGPHRACHCGGRSEDSSGKSRHVRDLLQGKWCVPSTDEFPLTYSPSRSIRIISLCPWLRAASRRPSVSLAPKTHTPSRRWCRYGTTCTFTLNSKPCVYRTAGLCNLAPLTSSGRTSRGPLTCTSRRSRPAESLFGPRAGVWAPVSSARSWWRTPTTEAWCFRPRLHLNRLLSSLSRKVRARITTEWWPRSLKWRPRSRQLGSE